MRLPSYFARRFVAGDTMAQAMTVVRNLNTDSLEVSLDVLGEEVSELSGVEAATSEYLALLDEIAKHQVRSDVSVKPTQLGLGIDPELCVQQVTRVAQKAQSLGNFLWVDMEGSGYTGSTLDVFQKVHHHYPNMGLALQAYLYRSEEDARRLGGLKAAVRVCKGAYKESPFLAYQRTKDVRRSFTSLVEILMRAGSRVAIATHDDRLIEWSLQWTKQNQIPRERFEFQMLYGLRRKRARKLAEDGFTVRSYVPYGTHWFPYMMRRLRERKENVFFVLKSLIYD